MVEQNGARQLYLSFDGFAINLQARLDNGATVRRVVAPGAYDNGTLTARRINVVLE